MTQKNISHMAGERYSIITNMPYAMNVFFNIAPIGRILGSNSTGDARGIWYSDDNGETWTISDLTDVKIVCFIPANNKIYAASNSKIFYSINNGKNWIACTTNFPKTIYTEAAGIYIESINRLLIITNQSYLYYTDDNGETWQSPSSNGTLFTNTVIVNGVATTANYSASIAPEDLCLLPNNNILLLGTGGNGNRKGLIFISTDYGVTWTIQSHIFLDAIYDVSWKKIFRSSTGRIIITADYNAAESGYNRGGIWYSDDNGINFIQASILFKPLCNIVQLKSGELYTICVFNNDPSSHYSICSTDDGATWHIVEEAPNIVLYPNSSSLCVTNTGRLLLREYYSDTEYTVNKNVYLSNKRLNFFITQFKAYVQSLKS